VATALAGLYANLHLTQADNHTSTSPHGFFPGWMPSLPPNQQHQHTEDSNTVKPEQNT